MVNMIGKTPYNPTTCAKDQKTKNDTHYHEKPPHELHWVWLLGVVDAFVSHLIVNDPAPNCHGKWQRCRETIQTFAPLITKPDPLTCLAHHDALHGGCDSVPDGSIPRQPMHQ